jgi:hypothetical protein
MKLAGGLVQVGVVGGEEFATGLSHTLRTSSSIVCSFRMWYSPNRFPNLAGGDMATDATASNSVPEFQEPTGTGDYEVQPGDCIQSIALQNRLSWQKIWNHPANAELKRQRSPNILLPGDRVTIPPIQPRVVEACTDQTHHFVLLGAKTNFKLRFLDDRQQPRAGVPYVLTIDGKTLSGTLNGQGGLEVLIPCNASQGHIQLQTDPPETYPLNFGHLDPNSSPTGLRARLRNLGFTCVNDGGWDDDLQKAIRKYQLVRNLPVTGQLDDQTAESLQSDHQS